MGSPAFEDIARASFDDWVWNEHIKGWSLFIGGRRFYFRGHGATSASDGVFVKDDLEAVARRVMQLLIKVFSLDVWEAVTAFAGKPFNAETRAALLATLLLLRDSA